MDYIIRMKKEWARARNILCYGRSRGRRYSLRSGGEITNPVIITERTESRAQRSAESLAWANGYKGYDIKVRLR